MLDPGVARRIRLVGFDVDGVLTDNGVYIGQVGQEAAEFKRFHIQDGLGLKLLQLAGLRVFLLSGRLSDATRLRAEELGIALVYQDGRARKLPILTDVLESTGVDWPEVVFVGDDLADLPVMRRVGLPVAVANAVPEVKEVATYVTEKRGGDGAAREVVESLLRARGEWDDVLTKYFAQRGGMEVSS